MLVWPLVEHVLDNQEGSNIQNCQLQEHKFATEDESCCIEKSSQKEEEVEHPCTLLV